MEAFLRLCRWDARSARFTSLKMRLAADRPRAWCRPSALNLVQRKSGISFRTRRPHIRAAAGLAAVGRLLVPIEIRPHVGTPLAAGLAHKPRGGRPQNRMKVPISRPAAKDQSPRVQAETTRTRSRCCSSYSFSVIAADLLPGGPRRGLGLSQIGRQMPALLGFTFLDLKCGSASSRAVPPA